MDIQPINQSQAILELTSYFLQVLGWPAIVVGAWKMRGWLNAAEDHFAEKLDKMTDNHLRHIQKAMATNARTMKEVVTELKELRNDIRLAQFKK
jgi:hypothetical protein